MVVVAREGGRLWMLLDTARRLNSICQQAIDHHDDPASDIRGCSPATVSNEETHNFWVFQGSR